MLIVLSECVTPEQNPPVHVDLSGSGIAAILSAGVVQHSRTFGRAFTAARCSADCLLLYLALAIQLGCVPNEMEERKKWVLAGLYDPCSRTVRISRRTVGVRSNCFPGTYFGTSFPGNSYSELQLNSYDVDYCVESSFLQYRVLRWIPGIVAS